ncbi:MAG: sigma-54-dependent Fis family transcriptional regulator [Methylobacillus glycogenes]|nr:sigma-54-dependent Fis family transcriptional regulator [Methylobacillus glycogenes]
MTHRLTTPPRAIEHARQQFLAEGEMQGGVVNATIAQSWLRSRENGVLACQPLSTETLDSTALAQKRSQNHLLLTQAKAEISSLYEQIAHSYSMIALTDAEGVILHTRGEHQLMGLAPAELLSPGYSWREQERGTNAIGTAIIERQAVAVQGAEHFVEQLHTFSCYAVPIFGANYELLGTLNVTNAFSAHQQHTLALVKMAAQLIENRVFRASDQGPVTLKFHERAEFIDTEWAGVAVFERDGRVVAINHNGLQQLGCNTLPQDYQQLFGQPLPLQAEPAVLSLSTSLGHLIKARLTITAASKASALRPVVRRGITLEDLASPDRHIAEVLEQARLVMDQDIPILIQGETGVGKELLTSAIHNSSSRADGPMIAVNCAALPEGLIEAELFGYEEGAFTGARQKGSQGKIEQANGGTLFLDEIGDMPLLLQARLLRVLQERSITPLGGSKAKKLEFALISATNQPLQDKVAAGTFRRDLYYRLNGLSLTLPPLRSRHDLPALVQSLLTAEQATNTTLNDDLLALFQLHPWPGNIRQLHNVLKTMLALAAGQPLQRKHLPPDFMEELGTAAAEQTAMTALAAGSITDITNEAVRLALQQHNGNISAAARELGMSRNRFYRKLKALGLG